MNRPEFLLIIWSKIIKPLLLLAIICFCISFLYHVVTAKGTARFITILVFIIGILFTVAYFIGSVFGAVKTTMEQSLPKRTLHVLAIFGKIMNYIYPVILVIMIYFLWGNKWQDAVFLITVVVLQRLIHFIQGDSLSAKSTSK